MPISILNRYYIEAVICMGILLLAITSTIYNIYDLYKYKRYNAFARAFSAVALISGFVLIVIVTVPVKNASIILDTPNVICNNYREISGRITSREIGGSPKYSFRSYGIYKYHVESTDYKDNCDVYLLCTEDKDELLETKVTVRYYPLSHMGCITKTDWWSENLVFSKNYTNRTAEIALYVTLDVMFILMGIFYMSIVPLGKIGDFAKVEQIDRKVTKGTKFILLIILLFLLTYASMRLKKGPLPEGVMLFIYAIAFIDIVKDCIEDRNCLAINCDKPIMRNYHGIKKFVEEFPCEIVKVEDDFCKDTNDKEHVAYDIFYKDKKMRLDSEAYGYGFEEVDALYKKLHEEPSEDKVVEREIVYDEIKK